MGEAIKYYRLAIKYKCETSVPFEIEEFIVWVLDLEPEHADRMKLLNLIETYRAGVEPSLAPAETPEPDPEMCSF